MKDREYLTIISVDELRASRGGRGGFSEYEMTITRPIKVRDKDKKEHDLSIQATVDTINIVISLKAGDKIPCIKKKALLGNSYYYEIEDNLIKYPIIEKQDA